MSVTRYTVNTTIADVRDQAFKFFESVKVTEDGKFSGYRHSQSTTLPVLYSTVAVVLTKHLFGESESVVREELDLILAHQADDGLFKDQVIACKQAEEEDWWGWRHLTLHCLMALALYDRPAEKEIAYSKNFLSESTLKNYLAARDWGKRVAWTSNELQNLAVMLQYARDYHHVAAADTALQIIYKEIYQRQDSQTGLYGDSFKTYGDFSNGVQAGYHFWLLLLYDNLPITMPEKIIDHTLFTQNIVGGYSLNWNSSACEDIDSIDVLLRLQQCTEYRSDDIQASLSRALPQILFNLNTDGGWVFKRNEELTVVHPQMYSGVNESNVLYTWFRLLGLAYCLLGLDNVPEKFSYPWNFKKAPGHQFL